MKEHAWKYFLCVPVLCGLLVSPCLASEDPAKFPSRQITMIVQWAAGGNTDLTARKLSDLAGKILGQPIVVVNKTGGGGVIGAQAVATADPDGYTIATATASPFVYAPHLREVPYKTKENFTWIMQYAEAPQSFGVLTESRWKTFKDFVEEARKNPGKLTYAASGPMSSQHVYMEQIAKLENIKLTHIPLGGGAEVATKLLGGHLDAGFAGELLQHVQAGKVRILAFQAENRLPQFPDIPTFIELGYKIDPIIWWGIYGPKGLNPVVLKKISEALKKAYDDPSFRDLLSQWFMAPIYRDVEGFTAKVYKDYDNNERVLKEFSK